MVSGGAISGGLWLPRLVVSSISPRLAGGGRALGRRTLRRSQAPPVAFFAWCWAAVSWRSPEEDWSGLARAPLQTGHFGSNRSTQRALLGSRATSTHRPSDGGSTAGLLCRARGSGDAPGGGGYLGDIPSMLALDLRILKRGAAHLEDARAAARLRTENPGQDVGHHLQRLDAALAGVSRRLAQGRAPCARQDTARSCTSRRPCATKRPPYNRQCQTCSRSWQGGPTAATRGFPGSKLKTASDFLVLLVVMQPRAPPTPWDGQLPSHETDALVVVTWFMLCEIESASAKVGDISVSLREVTLHIPIHKTAQGATLCSPCARCAAGAPALPSACGSPPPRPT